MAAFKGDELRDKVNGALSRRRADAAGYKSSGRWRIARAVSAGSSGEES